MALDKKWHIEHFQCQFDGCEVKFRANDSYCEHQDGVYCQAHYIEHFAMRCVKCNEAIMEQQYVETNRGCWHAECYGLDRITKDLGVFEIKFKTYYYAGFLIFERDRGVREF
jgi:hypothetical protein